jgi:hypothetical protein
MSAAVEPPVVDLASDGGVRADIRNVRVGWKGGVHGDARMI